MEQTTALLLLNDEELEALRLAATTMLLAMNDCKPESDPEYVALSGAVHKIGRPLRQKPERVKGWTAQQDNI